MLDHWPINVLGGRMQLIGEDNLIHALLFSFTGQSPKIAPRFVSKPGDSGVPTLVVDDPLHTELRSKVKSGFGLIQSLFQVEVDLDRTEAEYEAEADIEEKEISITRFTFGDSNNNNTPIRLEYSYFTRAMMAAENPIDESLGLFATLTVSAREAAFSKRFIDSFRYSFLIFDALFGGGQFKKAGLEKAFKSEPRLLNAIAVAAAQHVADKARPVTPTGLFLASKPSPEIIAEHLVERRGHYFHNNPSKPKAWKADNQDEARDLAWLCIGICFELSADYSAPMFADQLGPRHFAEAKKAGALLVLRIDYTYQNADEEQARQGRTDINIPGTKVTRAMATEAAKSFLTQFTENLPVAGLLHAICRQADTNQPVFEFRMPKDLP